MRPAELENTLSPSHQRLLERAVQHLESQDFAGKLADYAGQPLNKALRLVPKAATRRFNDAVQAAILNCLNVAVRSIEQQPQRKPAERAAAMMVGVTGGLSGFFGVSALPLELPVTTTLMLRSIAEIARHHGEDLSTIEARLACVEVFALGTPRSSARPDVGYFASRALLGRLAGKASTALIERSTANFSTPVVGSFVSEVAARFGVVVSERAAASAMPVLGAIGGATVNMIFMNHFQRVARGHFAVRHLERHYGEAVVRRHYEEAAARRGRSMTA